ncbi:MAG: hypothetical protein K1X29_04230 [Bdellovibrionales bacterium]|nr:hypothetical protein [Bdellovibrionales bacterium]
MSSRSAVMLLLSLSIILVYCSSEAKKIEKIEKIKMTQKVRGDLTVNLELEGSDPQGAGDEFTLNGTIQSGESIELLQLHWTFSPNIQLIEGQQQEENLSLPVPGQALQRVVRLKLKSMGKVRVYLKAMAFTENGRYGATAYYTLQNTKTAETAEPGTLKTKNKSLSQEPKSPGIPKLKGRKTME